jgi:hypothetical protein
MKPIHYIKKYKLNIGTNFSHNEFIQDLTTDFITLLEVGKTNSGQYVLKGFENTVRAIRMKWEGINNKTSGELPEKLWKYFYATVIVKMREELFPDEMARRKEEREERKRDRENYQKWQDQEFGFSDYFFNFFHSIFKSQNTIPSSSFDLLGIGSDSSETDIKQSYRTLAKKHHPDAGGNPKNFMEITEAKNKCLTYLKNKL